ncbi:MAG TPA: MBL fold metallo-hydrolase [Microvirga sp.]|jgi:phosphoribosyl 1,2-cyclic phosphate phosphodiesterase|nr:MBL fold metallo-hydrolase [Microvirga sp.]
MNLRLTILGCGSSGGVPRVAVGWGACDPSNPKNRRRRCSVLLERKGAHGTTTVLVDTTPDLRDQLIGADVRRLDGVIYTHEHADHTHGIDDLRPLAIVMRRRVPVYMDEATGAMLEARFAYCFRTPPGSQYPPILEARPMTAGQPLTIDGPGGAIEALPFRMVHGDIDALGLRIGDVVYAPDVSHIPDESLRYFEGLDTLIIDALRYTPHPSHLSLSEALALIERVRPRRAVLTNLHTDLDYETLRSEIPDGVDPAFDGLTVDIALPADRRVSEAAR